MATNIEIEAKVLISHKDYKKLINGLSANISREFHQMNYFIETDNFDLRKAGIGLRIRNVNGEYIMTMKAPMSEGLLEKHSTVTLQEYRDFATKQIFPENDICEFVRMLGFDPSKLKIVTSLSTYRVETNYGKEDYLFSIDKNEYNGIIDYELEMAGNSLLTAQTQLKEICDEFGIKYEPNLKSKTTRALESLAQIKD